MAFLKLLGANWRFFAAAALVVTVWGTIVHLRNEVDRKEELLRLAEARAASEAEAATQERSNVDRLATLLEDQLALFERERDARRRAQRQRDEALSASQDRDGGLVEAFDTERETDATLAQCLDYELPDSILRQLPE